MNPLQGGLRNMALQADSTSGSSRVKRIVMTVVLALVIVGAIVEISGLRKRVVESFQEKTEALSASGQAIAELEKRGVEVSRSFGKTILMMDFNGIDVTDDDLAILKDVDPFPRLNLTDTQITDAGLVHIRDLESVFVLDLSGTQVTDNGLEQLKGMADLRHLLLSNTQVTDAGLVHLEGLGQLQVLKLEGTQVTEEGLASLQQTLPNLIEVAGPEPPEDLEASEGSEENG